MSAGDVKPAVFVYVALKKVIFVYIYMVKVNFNILFDDGRNLSVTADVDGEKARKFFYLLNPYRQVRKKRIKTA